MTRIIRNLAEIGGDYGVLFCDLWGCVHNGKIAYPAAISALQAYRVFSDPDLNAELRLFSGKTIDVPSLFIGGKRDWGTYSAPGALDLMRTKATTRMACVTGP